MPVTSTVKIAIGKMVKIMVKEYLKTKGLFLCSFWFISAICAQQSTETNIPDSLLDKSFKELRDIYFPMNRDSLAAIPFVTAHSFKAKIARDTLELARSYRDMGYISSPAIETKYADSIILLTKEMVHKTFPAYGYATKAKWLYDQRLYIDALDNYILAYESAIKSGNKKRQETYRLSIATLKNRIGKYDEAIKIYREQLKNLNEVNRKNVAGAKRKLLVIFNMHISYIRQKKLDSAQKYQEIGLKESKRLGDTLNFQKFYVNKGILLSMTNKHNRAIEILSETLHQRKGKNKCTNYYYRGKSFMSLDSIDKGIQDFMTIDSIVRVNSYNFPELLDVYKTLSGYFEDIKNYKLQIEYINKYITVDSLLDIEYKGLNQKMYGSYDFPELERKRMDATTILQKKSADYKKYLVYLSIAGTILALALTWYILKKRKLEKSFNQLISQTENSGPYVVSSKRQNELNALENISSTVLKEIRSRLKEFEKNKGYLSNEVNLHWLAKKINTNPNYLSKVINNDTNKNFNNYINDLRVYEAIERLKIDGKIRKLNIKYIAEEMGFNNPESFSKSFKKVSGMYPSYFIKKIELKESKFMNRG